MENPTGVSNQQVPEDVKVLQGTIEQSTGTPTEETNQRVIPRFKDVRHAELSYRELQSKYDKVTSELQKLVQERDQYVEKASVFEQIMQDEELLTAFISELKPDLFPQQTVDIKTKIHEELVKEFGEDYKDKLLDPLELIKIQDKTKALYEKYSNDTKKKSVKAVIEERNQKLEQYKKQIEDTVEFIKNTYKVDDTVIQEYARWKERIVMDDKEMFKIYRSQLKYLNNNTPALSRVQGSGVQGTGLRDSYLKSW